MSLLMRLGACALALLAPPALAQSDVRRPQYVIISFDGALHIEQWERSRALAERTGARFTYFLSCVYLLTPDTLKAYRSPGMAAGRTNIGRGFSTSDVRLRLEQIWQARSEGHEIASHACGHFDGGAWSAADWKHELEQFRTILRDAWSVNRIDGEPADWRSFAENEVVGFRAPYLSTGKGLFTALAAEGFRYDASTVSNGPAEAADKGGVTRFSLPMIPEGPRGRRVIAMDYNLYARHSGAKENTAKAAAFAARAYEAFHAAFAHEYAGDRIPLQLGFHFTLMNGGAYWEALERFAEEVCVKSEVRCVGYRQYLEETAPVSAALRPSIGG
ncbi:polysaccharide deacetylase [Chelativorans sp. M5D2P16]|uniref:polysaccharide deacetylase n=1 Tax=Chelativorans sp. M5D2P16 TaxID=3095678 RepID=UPI002ACA6079|nr:polysaccharide deacetylase [Chelativorans sp. M5D2P16]MDZ5698888.1 polysaccharide deacetylase [Chelativorans sp. M5D2P16]